MIHELAHYVGPIPKAFVIDGIEDHAYFHKGSQSYKNLAPEKAFKNADCYAQFAFDAVGKPDYDATQNRS
jgi:hypothetical protein